MLFSCDASDDGLSVLEIFDVTRCADCGECADRSAEWHGKHSDVGSVDDAAGWMDGDSAILNESLILCPVLLVLILAPLLFCSCCALRSDRS